MLLARRMYNESRHSGEGMEDNQQEKSWDERLRIARKLKVQWNSDAEYFGGVEWPCR